MEDVKGRFPNPGTTSEFERPGVTICGKRKGHKRYMKRTETKSRETITESTRFSF